MKVSNMKSHNGINAANVPNQFILESETEIVFQSYATIIAKKVKTTGEVFLDSKMWDCSKTTGKYRNDFLNEGIAETRKKIASGEYKLIDLNYRRA